MNDIQKGFDFLNKNDKDKAVEEIIAYFLDQRNETIGVIAAQGFLDFFQQNIGKNIYNKAIEDTKAVFKKELEEWDYSLNELMR